MGHSEGIMRTWTLAFGATPLVGAPALIAFGPVLLPAQIPSQELKHWGTATWLDIATLLFRLFAELNQRGREIRPGLVGGTAPEVRP